MNCEPQKIEQENTNDEVFNRSGPANLFQRRRCALAISD
ncbi:hypothetical protein D1AOALGA4SA_2033 [Olavius algarvensis Delta 1 endosymbiont]|nr:hypothetical protein D1AOALGA4SA_2033 [Olavius algarvensis Delta 1 endosymbiont]